MPSVFLVAAVLQISVADGELAPLPVERSWQLAPNCGPNALYCMLRLYDRDVQYESLLNRLMPGSDGSSLLEMKKAAGLWGLSTAVLKPGYDSIDNVRTPFIAHLEEGGVRHYILIVGRRGRDFEVWQPGSGTIDTLSRQGFNRSFTGYVLATGTDQGERLLLALVCAEAVLLLVVIARGCYLSEANPFRWIRDAMSPVLRRRWLTPTA